MLFIQYKPNKPDKVGIKFRLLVDVSSKRLCNAEPYLGKDPTRNRENNLLADICLDAIRKQKKEVRKVEAIMKDKPLHSSEVFVSPSNATLTIYKAKKAKLVRLLSSMHKTVSVDLAHKKNYPKLSSIATCQKLG